MAKTSAIAGTRLSLPRPRPPTPGAAPAGSGRAEPDADRARVAMLRKRSTMGPRDERWRWAPMPQDSFSWQDPSLSPRERATKLVAAMTLEQKIAQLHGAMETIDI